MKLEISFEEILLNKSQVECFLKKFIEFEQISIYFPKDSNPIHNITKKNSYIKLLSKEKKLLFFLTDKKNQKFIISLAPIVPKQVKNILPHLSQILELIIHNIILEKNIKLDPYTDTLQLKYFLDQISIYIENLANHLIIGPESVIVSDIDSLHGRFCIAGIKLFGLKRILKDLGFTYWLEIIKQVSQAISLYEKNIYFNQEDIFFILCKENISAIENKMDLIKKHIEKTYSLKKNLYLNIYPIIIYLTYPSHLPGYLLKKQDKDLSYELLNILTKGFDLIEKKTISNIKSPIALPELIKIGAKIQEATGNLVKINIGEDLGIRCGQYFGVLDEEKGDLKAEILITNSSREDSQGEIIFFYNPFKSIKSGDTLIPLWEIDREKEYKNRKNYAPTLNNFITTFYQGAKGINEFSILIIKGPIEKRNEIIDKSKQAIDKKIMIQDFGADTSILFLPNINITIDSKLFENLKVIINSSQDLCLGITNYPLLDLSRHETIRYSIECLEHACLMGSVKIAIFDSITFNIIGDKYFIKGDIYSAITEYKRAIALDPKNHVARNSLGICYARIGELSKAWREFNYAYEETSSITYLYNLGSIYFKLNNFKKAQESFLKCIDHKSYHIYSLVKLAQLCESQGDIDKALDYLNKVNPCSFPLIYKYKAKIFLKKKKINKAKEYLENAIRENPMDAEAIFLLGKIYIENNKDKTTGKTLIEKSIHLNPNNLEYRTYLSHIQNTLKDTK